MFAAVGGFRYTDIAGGDPYWNSVGFLQNSEYQAVVYQDTSTTNEQFTPIGPIVSSVRTPFTGSGGSIYLSGSGAAYLNGLPNSALNLGTGNFTVEAWVYVTNFGVNFGGYMPLLSWGGGSWKTFRVRPTAFNFQTPIPSNLDYNANWPSTMVVNTWYHVALVRSSTTTVTAYLNGTAGTAVTINSNASFGNASDLFQVGYKGDPGYWWGYISNLRITKSAVYTGNFTPATSPLSPITNTVLMLNFSNTGVGSNTSAIVDESINSAVVTTSGSVHNASFSPYGVSYPGCVRTFGTGHMTVPSITAYTYGTGDFTIECWVRFQALTAAAYIIDQRNSGTATAIIPTLYVNGSQQLTYYVNGADRINGSTTLTTGVWYHVAVSRVSSSTKMFLNGVQEGSTYADTNNYAASRGVFGSAGNAAGSYVNGYFNNIRLSKGIGYYSSNFTPSTTPLTADVTNTSLFISCDNAGFYAFQPNNTTGLYIQQNANTQTVYAMTTPSVYKFGTQGTAYAPTSYQLVAGLTGLVFSTGAFTVEGWVYINVTGTNKGIISMGTTASAGWLLRLNTSNQFEWFNNSTPGTALLTSTATVSASTWTYFAVTRDGSSNLYMFVNGTLQGSSVTDTTDYLASTNLYVGSQTTTNGLNGYLDDIRITTGVCRYTSSFSAPTSAFPTSA